MADEKKNGELCHVGICKAENGWKISCQYEYGEKTLGQRAGWVPSPMYGDSKDYVEKTKDAVIKRLKEIL